MAAARHEDRGALRPPAAVGHKKAPRPTSLAPHMQPPGGLRELVVQFTGPPPFRLCGRGDIVSEGNKNWPQRVLHIPDVPHIVEDPPNPDFLRRSKVGWDNDGRRNAENCFVRRIQRGWRIIEVNRVPLAPEDVPAALAQVQDMGKYTITFDFTACQSELATSPSEARQPPQQEKPWKCPKSFPMLHAALEGHLYKQPSRVGPPRWKHPEMVAGTRQWYESNNMSYKRRARDPGRGTWVSSGGVHGELPKGAPRWPESQDTAKKQKSKKKKKDAFTSKVSLFLSRDVHRSAESLLSLSGSQSLPSLVLGQVPYPPTPAFVRDLMRRWCQEDAAREEERLRKEQEAQEAYMLALEQSGQMA